MNDVNEEAPIPPPQNHTSCISPSPSSKIPSMASIFASIFLSFSLLAVTAAIPSSPIGVTYNPPADRQNQPSPEQVAVELERLRISSVRLPTADPAVVRAFSYSNISLLITVPNNLIPAIASNRANAAAWLYGHVVPFYPRARISLIAVGSDVLVSDPDLSNFLLPAIRNVHVALHELGIRRISVSSAFSFINTFTTAFPPSAAEFQDPAAGLILKPLLDFLEETNSSFLVNLYPYNVYRLNAEVPIGFALFQEAPFNFRDDPITGVRYRNLYDTMVDAVITAMAVAGHEDIPVIVAETGWPCIGAQPAEVDANEVYAEMYLRGLIKHLNSGIGTPLRKEGALAVYVYELFDSHGRRQSNLGFSSSSSSSSLSSASDRNWGIMYPNMTRKYSIDFSGCSGVQIGRTEVVTLLVMIWFTLVFFCFFLVNHPLL